MSPVLTTAIAQFVAEINKSVDLDRKLQTPHENQSETMEEWKRVQENKLGILRSIRLLAQAENIDPIAAINDALYAK